MEADLGYLACRLLLGLVPADEVDDAKATLRAAGMEFNPHTGRWSRARRPDPPPVSGEIVRE